MGDYEIQFCGDVNRCCTCAEIYRRQQFVASLCETADGWQVHIESNESRDEGLQAAVDTAKERLLQYVNRKGMDAPSGLTRAGLSLWLLQKTDGTAMGISMPEE